MLTCLCLLWLWTDYCFRLCPVYYHRVVCLHRDKWASVEKEHDSESASKLNSSIMSQAIWFYLKVLLLNHGGNNYQYWLSLEYWITGLSVYPCFSWLTNLWNVYKQAAIWTSRALLPWPNGVISVTGSVPHFNHNYLFMLTHMLIQMCYCVTANNALFSDVHRLHSGCSEPLPAAAHLHHWARAHVHRPTAGRTATACLRHRRQLLFQHAA